MADDDGVVGMKDDDGVVGMKDDDGVVGMGDAVVAVGKGKLDVVVADVLGLEREGWRVGEHDDGPPSATFCPRTGVA
jgi:hypothetical protein